MSRLSVTLQSDSLLVYCVFLLRVMVQMFFIGDVPLSYIVDPVNRTAWIQEKSPVSKESVHGWNKHRCWAGSGDRFLLNTMLWQPLSRKPLKFPHRDPRLSGKQHFSSNCVILLLKSPWRTMSSYHKSQVSFDVAWSPKCIDKRCYDYLAIADSCDSCLLCPMMSKARLGRLYCHGKCPLHSDIDR